jgi:hypothetical protein
LAFKLHHKFLDISMFQFKSNTDSIAIVQVPMKFYLSHEFIYTIETGFF